MTKKCVKYAFMFVICLVVPCLFCFAGCSNTAVAVTEQEWETAFTGMTNYSIIGGISNTDADYGEYYFQENGFRVYTPNNNATNRQDAYLQYNTTTNEYVKYTKLTSSNEWEYSTITQDVWTQTINSVKELYIPFIDKCDAFVVVSDTQFKSNKEIQITKTISGQQYTYHYFDIVINLDNKGSVTSATWKQKISTSSGAESKVYNMTLQTNRVSLAFPESHAVSETAWSKLLNLSTLNAVTTTQKNNGNNANIWCYDGTVLYNISNYEYVYKIVDNEYHSYVRESGESNWKQATSVSLNAEEKLNDMFEISINFASKFEFDNFEYDSSTHTYKSKTSFNVSGGFTGTNGVISFTNGKCTQISYQYTQNNATVDVVITIDYAVTDMPSDLPE